LIQQQNSNSILAPALLCGSENPESPSASISQKESSPTTSRRTTKKIPALGYIYKTASGKEILDLTDGTVSGTKHNIAMPNGLLPLLITHLEQAAAGTTPKDDAPTPK
jgi:hypothetical protein